MERGPVRLLHALRHKLLGIGCSCAYRSLRSFRVSRLWNHCHLLDGLSLALRVANAMLLACPNVRLRLSCGNTLRFNVKRGLRLSSVWRAIAYFFLLVLGGYVHYALSCYAIYQCAVSDNNPGSAQASQGMQPFTAVFVDDDST